MTKKCLLLTYPTLLVVLVVLSGCQTGNERRQEAIIMLLTEILMLLRLVVQP